MPAAQPHNPDIGRLFRHLREAVVVVEAARNEIVLWNPAASRLFGYGEEEILGRPLEALIAEHDHARARAALAAYRRTGPGPSSDVPTVLELVARDKSGRELAVEVTLTALDPEAEPRAWVMAEIRDATQHTAAEGAVRESEERFRLMVEAVQDYAIFMLDTNGVVSSWNTGAQRIKGYRADEIIGHHFSRFYPPEDVAADKPGRELEIAKAEGRVEDEGWRVRKDGSRFWANVVITALYGADGRLRGFGKVTRDITERKRAEDERQELMRAQAARLAAEAGQERLGFLAEASNRLSASLDPDAILTELAGLSVPRLADWCSVYLLDQAGAVRRVALAHADPAKLAWAQALEDDYPPSPSTARGVYQVLRSGQSEMHAEIPPSALAALAVNAEHLRVLEELGPCSSLVVPLRVRERTLGVLTLIAAESGRRFATPDLALAEDLARRAALAVENARLYQQVQTALSDREATIQQQHVLEEQLTSLIEASGSLISTLQLESLLATILEVAQRLVAADAYAVWRFQPASNAWQVIAARGLSAAYQQATIRNYGSSRPFDMPILGEDVAATPQLADRVAGYRREGIRSMLVVPLWIQGEAAGSIAFYYRQQRRFAEIEVRLATALANIAAGAIGNAELYDQQRRLRESAERAQQRLAFLAEASGVLVASLEYETTLASLARLTIPDLADWSMIDLADESGGVQLVAVAHRDPDMVALAREFRERYPPTPDAPSGILDVLRRGRPEIVPDISDPMLAAVARDAEHLALMRRLGLVSTLYVPLLIRGQAVGVMTLAMAESGRHYGLEDLAMAEEVARRAGVAVDNARLYAEAQEAIRVREEFLSIASHELKTPVTGLQLQVQMLQRLVSSGTLAELPAERVGVMLERAERQTKQLSKLINGLLDLSRITAGRFELELEPIDLAEVTARVAELFGPELAASGSRLTLQAGTPVIGAWDRSRLEQVINNLLANAIKYGNGQPITVSVAQEDGTASLVVRDEGIGIPPEHLERIFGRFERAVASHNYGGFGLGLYIVRQIVEALGGAVTVTSAPDAGSTFRVQLPLQGPDPP